MTKAIYKGKVRDRNGYAVHLLYEYRGREYMVTDGHNGYSESLNEQHKYEQNRIDMILDSAIPTAKTTAQEGLDLFFSFYE